MQNCLKPTAVVMLLVLVGSLAAWQPSHAEVDIRFYDLDHRDYHRWDSNEDRAYRSYREGRREPYREFRHLSRDHQRGYWNWRHEHPDSDRR